MTFRLQFHENAWQEWNKIDKSLREQFKKKLNTSLQKLSVKAARVSGGSDLYKIKLRATGFRLIYQIRNECVTVLLLTVGKRDRNAVYNTALGRA